MDKKNLNILKKDLELLLKENPTDLNTILSLGKLLGSSKDHKKAEKIFEKGTVIYPENDTLNYNYAIALSENKKFYKSAIILRKLLSKHPDKNIIMLGYANVLHKLKKYKLSLKYYYKLHYKNKSDIDVLTNIGIVLISLKDYSKALSFLELAFHAKNNSSLLSRNIALCYKNLSRLKEAMSFYIKSINLETSYIGSYLALGSIYLDLNENELAESTFQKASIVAKDILSNSNTNNITEVVLNDIGVLFTILGDFAMAEKTLKIMAENISFNSYHKMLLSENLLSMGKFREGWALYESRFDYYLKEKKIDHYKKFPKPRWEPEMGSGKILIWAEQGLGDQILFGTIIKDFIIRFKKVYLMVDTRLKKHFTKNYNQIEVIGFDENLNPEFYDYHIPLGSVAQYTRKTFDDFKSIKIKSYDEIDLKAISSKRKIKCAVSWKSINSFKSKDKSIKLKELRSVLGDPKIDFYNIQYTDEMTELNELKQEYGISLKDPNGIDTYNDIDGLMNFINSCDFVISVSNTNAHISGVLNKQTLLLLPKIYGTWWYWNNQYLNKNIWYPSVKVFPQKRIGDWSSAINNLKEYLQKSI